MCIPNRLSSNAPNVTLCESSVKVICGKLPCIINMGNLPNPKVVSSLQIDKIKLAIKSCECRILSKECGYLFSDELLLVLG
tara:strand:+ start:2461 stop:2703 length:243 start_codon:yes stop_codon:yes gene_type:complete